MAVAAGGGGGGVDPGMLSDVVASISVNSKDIADNAVRITSNGLKADLALG